jgi:guanine deaminase
METNNFILRGDILWSGKSGGLESQSGAYLVCAEGKSAGVFSRLPEEYAAFPLLDYSGRLVIPGLVDLHTHAPQFAFRAAGMDLELLDWLETRAFPEEAKYRDEAYARRAYGILVERLKRGPNTRIVLFATVHVPATLLLMDMLEESGLVCLVGKVNMDRNSPDCLREESAAASLAATREWLAACRARTEKQGGGNVLPVLTPRFIPSCSDELMRGLSEIQREYGLPVQSHLSENRKEIEWVRELCPSSSCYGGAYDDFGLFGNGAPTIMAHCVWPDEREIELAAERGVYIAHCPQSNANLSSGIAPVRKFLERGLSVGLGSDVAGGVHTSIFRAMTDAVQVSKLRRALLGESSAAVSLEEAFYLGTRGGGEFFGAAGSFDPGYDFDALVIDDSELAAPFELSLRDRLERVIYLSEDRQILAKFARGRQIFRRTGHSEEESATPFPKSSPSGSP